VVSAADDAGCAAVETGSATALLLCSGCGGVGTTSGGDAMVGAVAIPAPPAPPAPTPAPASSALLMNGRLNRSEANEGVGVGVGAAAAAADLDGRGGVRMMFDCKWHGVAA